MKWILLNIVVLLFFANSVVSQTDEIKKRGLEFALLYYNYNNPALNISYCNELIWPKKGIMLSNGLELLQVNKKNRIILTSRFSGNILKTKSGFSASIGLCMMMYYNLLYEKTDTLANLGFKPEITFGYKNWKLGYQINDFIFNIEPKAIGRKSLVLYYRINLWK